MREERTMHSNLFDTYLPEFMWRGLNSVWNVVEATALERQLRDTVDYIKGC